LTFARNTSKLVVYSYAIMEALKMSSWNDDRLDKRDEEVKEGFVRLESQIKDGFAETDERFRRLEGQIAETDKRVVRLEGEVKSGFAEVDKRFARLEGQASERAVETDKRFARLESQIMANRQETSEGFAAMQSAYASSSRTLFLVAGGIIAALVGAISALVVALAA
jgi:chromosome segregation ATPase